MLVRLVALSALLLAACASDFAEEEARPEAPTSMSTPLPARPVLKASFEPASPDCNGWLATGAKSIRSVPSRSGSYACKLCSDGSTEGFAISYSLGALEAGRYSFTAYTRKRPQNAAPAAAVASILAETSTGTVVVEANETTVREEWDRLEAIIDVPDGASSLRVEIGARLAASAECVLIDDVAIEKL